VAEEVAKVDPDLVARDDKGKPYTVRYEAVNSMLLNEFLKAHQKLETQSSEIAELKAAVSGLQASMQKMNHRPEANPPGR
jgi:chromosome segregation ATPase